MKTKEKLNVTIEQQDKFTYLDEYKKHFPIDDKTIFAWDDTIYSNYDMPAHLIEHEVTHLMQQKKHGLQEWKALYLNNEGFRLKMEIEAYKAQLLSIRDDKMRAKIWLESAKTLSSGLYGSLITKEQAIKLLKV